MNAPTKCKKDCIASHVKIRVTTTKNIFEKVNSSKIIFLFQLVIMMILFVITEVIVYQIIVLATFNTTYFMYRFLYKKKVLK